MAYLTDYILSTRYLRFNEKSYDDICERVSKAIGTTEEERKQFLQFMQKKEFVPGGRTIACAGTDKRLIPNCVVLPVEDTLEGVFDTLKRAAILQQAGCGLGFNFSTLRPASFPCVRTGGAASGPISFMNLYSHAFKIVQQYNRSGANMGIISIDHPDVLAFIHMKDNLSVMNNFNISVMLTKEFMDKLRDSPDELWFCTWKNEKLKPRFITYDKDMLVQDISELDITVKELWLEIVTAAWNTGEPGVLFHHNTNATNSLKPYYGDIMAVNPCVIAGTKLLTDNGPVHIEEHVGEVLNVWNGYEFTPALVKITGHDETVFDVELEDGRRLTCTKGHKFIIDEYGTRASLELLLKYKRMVIYTNVWDEGKNEEMNHEVSEGVSEEMSEGVTASTSDVTQSFAPASTSDVTQSFAPASTPISTSNSTPTSTPASTSPAHVPTHTSTRTYAATQSFTHINITQSKLGLIRIKSITENPIKASTVYCVTTLNDSHTATFNEIVTGNCGEIGLYSNECCNLGSINLEEFCSVNPIYNSPFEDVIKFIHTDKLHECSKLAITFLNRVVDKLDIPDKDLRVFVLILRRLGLGIMGFADVLIKLKVPYNSDLGRKVMEYVLNIIKTASHERSKELVNDYGSVSERMQNPKRYISVQDEGDSHSIEKITKLLRTNKGLNEDHLLSTAANCACTCIAPTGSTSMIHNVSSGIEPYFALAFKRSLNGKLQDAVVMNKHLEAYLRENDLYNDDVINTIIEQGISAVEEIRPEVKSIYITAQKMKPEDHILMQVSAQKYIDNSISKTCNFPHNASIEYVSTIYEMANEGLCKGVTVYRDGCRDSQVFVSTEKKKGTEGTKRSEWKDMKHSMSMDGCRSGSCDV